MACDARWDRSGSRASTPARPRRNALSAAATLISSSSAVSRAEKPRTSRNTSAARCKPGRYCSAATNASSTASRASYLASGAMPHSSVSG